MKEQDKIVYEKFLSGMSSIQRERVRFTLDKVYNFTNVGIVSRAERVFIMKTRGSKLTYFANDYGGVDYGLSIDDLGYTSVSITKTEAKLAKFIGIADVDSKSRKKAEIGCKVRKIRKSFGNAEWFNFTDGVQKKIVWLKRCAKTFAYQSKDYQYQVEQLEKYLSLKEELKQYS